MGVGVSTTPRPLYHRQRPPTHCTGRGPPPGFDPRTVQPVAPRFTDWAVPAATSLSDGGKFRAGTTSCILPHTTLTLILLTWTIWRALTNAGKWRMGLNLAFKWLNIQNREAITCKATGTANPTQTSTGPYGSRRLRLSDFQTVGPWMW